MIVTHLGRSWGGDLDNDAGAVTITSATGSVKRDVQEVQ